MFRRIVTYCFLVVYLFSSQEVREVFKLPVLVEHFTKHRSLNPEMSFADFFEMHYIHDVKDGDYKEDKKLPFKSYEGHHHTQEIFLSKWQKSFSIFFIFFEDKESDFYYVERFYTSDIPSIFRPPAFV